MKKIGLKKIGRHSARPAALAAGAALLFTAMPQTASAQAVGAFMRPGGGSGQRANAPAVSPSVRPAPSAGNQPAPQNYQPSRSYQPAPMQPGLFGRQPEPAFNSPSPFNSAPAFSSGPVVVIPEEVPQPVLRSPGIRYRNPQPEAPNRAYSNEVGPVLTNPGSRSDDHPSRNRGYNQADNQGYSSTPTDRVNTPLGPANGFGNSPQLPPVGPGNGFGSQSFSSTPTLRVNTPRGLQSVPRSDYRHDYFYSVNPVPIIAGGPSLLGGYYYGNYCDTAYTSYTYPSAYCAYSGFPQYICSPSVVVVSQPYCPAYVTSYLPFYPPIYPVTYNNNYYYVANEDRARDLEAGGDAAREALRNAYPADSYQAAFGDIARAWTEGDIKPFRKHVRDSDTRLSVFLNKKYSYSIASGDFVQITRDAMDRLQTVSFQFTRIRKAKNGDVTAFGKHVYHVSSTSGTQEGDTVPFDQSGADAQTTPYDQANDPTSGEEKTVYVSYTLRHRDSLWYVIAVDSSENSLVGDR